ncbi:BF3164 family lipoprotein [Echinicola rosea]|uniref:TolB-like 6-blade propeller-like n=1 Tax=Echinicola rosea TaxID=1807691 RepID=A0ABQ1VAM8_9BACT|nr:BF3164 family lipoprotein [Echinicola rosea]GGF48057.1 hypothetical protein GCM10011339_40780 [Echinicola rosea]
MLKYKFLIISIFLFSIGCSDQTKSTKFHKKFKNEDISETINLKGNKHIFEQIISPIFIMKKGDNLIIGESRRISPENPLIHIVNIKSKQYKQSKGVVGFGPGETPDILNLTSGLSENSFWVVSGMSKTFYEFNLEDTTLLASNQIKQGEDLYMAGLMQWSSDSTIICRMVNDPHQFVEFNISGNRIKNFGDWDNYQLGKDLNDYMMCDLHMGQFDGDASSGFFAAAGFYRDRIELLNRNKGTIVTIDGPTLSPPQFDIVSGNNGASSSIVVDYNEPLSYLDVAIDNNLIYGLYCGRNEKEINKKGEYGNRIFVFDVAGNILREYKLDISIRNITIDSEGDRILGVTTDKNPGIAEFPLP